MDTQEIGFPTMLTYAIETLAEANAKTGLWDNRRFQHCKKPLEETDHAYIYKTEKLSRYNVETRATCRTQIDTCFKGLING